MVRVDRRAAGWRQGAVARRSGRSRGMGEQLPAARPGSIEIAMLPVALLRPNSWNANRMRKAKVARHHEEVKAIRRIAKPIVVCREDEGYLIIDGEHSFRAAQAAGLEEVPCEVVELTAVERMRQSYLRNVHGR